MNRIKEIVKNITKQGWVTIISIIATIGIIILGVLLYSPKQTENIVEDILEVENVETIQLSEQQSLTREEVVAGKYKNDIQSANAFVQHTQEVQIGVIMNDMITADSCGDITFVTKRVAGPAVLTNSMRALFTDSVQTDFSPGNIIPTYHPELSFDKVFIENGIAKIYLTGVFSGSHNSWCDSDLAIAQIVETAKQFESVQSVEVFQNGVKIN